MSDAEPTKLYERREYRDPPIDEAVCELRFRRASEKWNAAIPGLFFEQIKDSYPLPPEEKVGLPVPQSPPGGPGIAISVGSPQPTIEFQDEDRLHRIALGPDRLAVVARAPYPGWEAFFSRIEHAAGAYADLGLDRAVVRIGLRYINRIKVSGDRVNLNDYFVSAPVTPDNFPEHIVNVFSRWESLYDLEDQTRRLIYTFASQPSEGDEPSVFLLDLDAIRLFPEDTDLDTALTSLIDLKKHETAAFESIITDRLREQFDAS